MRAVFFWEAAGLSLTAANPYGGLLARSLAELGVELIAGHAAEFTRAWLIENQGRVQVLHLNWPNYLYDAPDLAGRVSRGAALIDNLLLARTLGYQIVWTVHNLYPHESSWRELDRLVQLALAEVASALITHCEHARQLVADHFHRRADVFVIPHGHFLDVYPNTLDRTTARQQLGLDEGHFVYLFFGNLRQYKGVERLVEVFRSLPGEHLRLLLAAKLYNAYGEHFVEQVRTLDPRIVIHPARFFANDEFQRFFNAADVAVLPFVDVLTSGSAITALGFGAPLITPAVGCLSELVDDRMGVLYDPQQPAALATAMFTLQHCDLGPLRQAALDRAQSLDWPSIARRTLAVYTYSPNR